MSVAVRTTMLIRGMIPLDDPPGSPLTIHQGYP
jgi:hypothetical protein